MILKANNVTKYFGDFKALSNVSFQLNKGEVLAILGPSGAGKTVLLKCLGAIEPVSGGTVEFNLDNELMIINDSTMKAPGKLLGKISMVFQDIHLWPHMTVLDNIIEAPVHAKGLSKEYSISIAEKICDRLEISDQLNKFPAELSIGQQQRVAIARTLAVEPDVILLDEITSALDPERTMEIINIINMLAKMKMSLILVTHQVSLVKKLASRVLFIFGGEIIGICEALDDKNLANLPERAKIFLQAAN